MLNQWHQCSLASLSVGHPWEHNSNSDLSEPCMEGEIYHTIIISAYCLREVTSILLARVGKNIIEIM